MTEPKIRFEDGAGYERMMGVWSRLAGDIFLDWLAPRPGLRWVDVGCGNGAFTELLAARCAPAGIQGIDPSEAQIAFARGRPSASVAGFQTGDAMALPFPENSFEAAVMALVIFFVPDPAKSVAEMARVVAAGGSVSAYSWDILGGGFPYAALQEEMARLASLPLWPPSVEAAGIETSRKLWADAGLAGIETREIVVERTYADFDSYWRIAQTGPRLAASIAAMASADRQTLSDRLRARLAADAQGRITLSARANAIKGRVPA
jgi:SAM-dependent methyltransferase